MDIHAIADLLSTVGLVAGLVFAGYEWRSSRREARRQSQISVLRSFDSPEFVRAMRRVLDIPDGLTGAEIAAHLGKEGTDLAWYWLGVMESLGILVHDRFVDLKDVDQTYGGPVFLSFSKLHPFVADVRVRTGREAMHEWFQWLAEQLERYERETGRSPAHLRERDWRP